MKKKASNLVYIGGSLLLILVAIAITTIINRSSNTKSGEDIRAKAGITNNLQVTGVVSSVDALKGTLVVDFVKFASSTNKDTLGSWIVSAPQVDLSTLVLGAKVTLTIDANSFLISDHTMTATQIKTSQ